MRRPARSAIVAIPAGIAFAALSACQTAPQDYVSLHANQDAVTIAKRIAGNVGACWFDGDRAAFADLSYTPELSSDARPRILVVSKDDPAGLPQLVIEVKKARRGSDVRFFGPLMATSEAERINRDVTRWTGGGTGCA